MEKYLSGTGQIIHVHDKEMCARINCCVHNPSNHHMKDWPLHWRDDRGFFERICPHGIGHPDPDDVAFHALHGSDITVHGCDGCCSGG